MQQLQEDVKQEELADEPPPAPKDELGRGQATSPELSDQQLVDYLHQAVSEGDVVFVRAWLYQAEQRGMLDFDEETSARVLTIERAFLSPFFPFILSLAGRSRFVVCDPH
jgi:hypothetical protein